MDDFVFAYSLREVLYKRKGVTEQKQPKMEGDLMGRGEGKRVLAKEVARRDFEAGFCGLRDEDEELHRRWDWKTEVVDDLDGQECQVIHVEAEEAEDDG